MIGQRDCTTQYDLLPQIVTDDEDEVNQRRLNHPEKLSLPRKIAFIASILFACIVATAFLWLLPCPNPLSPCSHHNPKAATNQWTKVFQLKAFISGLRLVTADSLTGILLAFQTPFKSLSNVHGGAGAVFIRASDGHKIWEQNYPGEPTDFLCDQLDVNGDGINDCVVIGTRGFFAAINVSNGYIFWYIHDHLEPLGSFTFSSLSLPAIINDINNDKVDDMIVLALLGEHSHWHLILVSGGMGQLLGRPVPLPGCSRASFPVVVEDTLIVHCFNRQLNTSWVAAMNVSNLRNASLDPANVTDKERHKEVDNIHTFQGPIERFCLEVGDLDGDGIRDVFVASGNAEAVAFNGRTLNEMWIYKHDGHGIVDCKIDAHFAVITLLPTTRDRTLYDSLVIALKSNSGERLWEFSNHSLLSPTIVDGNFWPNYTVYKSYIRENNEYPQFIDKGLIQVARVKENMIFLNEYGIVIREIALRSNLGTCYDLEMKFPECLPDSTFHASSVIGELNNGDSPFVISVVTTVKESGNELLAETNVAKYSIS